MPCLVYPSVVSGIFHVWGHLLTSYNFFALLLSKIQMKKYFILFFNFIAIICSAQVSDTVKKYHVRLFHGETIFAAKIIYEPNSSRGDYIYVDTLKFKPEQVKNYENENGLFVNINNRFAKKEINGKINVYSYRPNEKSLFWYYEKENGSLHALNYTNLKNDIANNSDAIDVLNKIKKKRVKKRILAFTGGVVFVASIFILPVPALAMTIAKSLCMVIGVSAMIIALDNYPENYIPAIKAYNNTPRVANCI